MKKRKPIDPDAEAKMVEANARLEAKLGKLPSFRRLAAELGYSDPTGARECMLRCAEHGLIEWIHESRTVTAKGKRELRKLKSR